MFRKMYISILITIFFVAMDLKWSSSGNIEMQKHLHKFMRNLHCFA